MCVGECVCVSTNSDTVLGSEAAIFLRYLTHWHEGVVTTVTLAACDQ